MQQNHYYLKTHCMRSTNTNIYVYSMYESIVLDNIAIAGITNFGIEVRNKSASGTVTDVSVYGSPDSVEYFPIQNNLFNATIGPGEFKHCELVVVTGFLRVSVQTDQDINIDVYLHGNIS